MEVHPPEHGIHSWRDFFVHMGTICLGLLIALGLEQGVEKLHRRSEARELRDALGGENEEMIQDARASMESGRKHLQQLMERRYEVFQAVWQKTPMPSDTMPLPRSSLVYPDNPVYRSALTNGRLALLSGNEAYAYGDLNTDAEWVLVYEKDFESAIRKRAEFESEMPSRSDGSHAIDFSRVSPADMRTYLDLLTAEADATKTREWGCSLTRAVAAAIRDGVTEPRRLDEAEQAAAKSDAETLRNPALDF